MAYVRGRVSQILAAAHEAGILARQLLDPSRYAPDFELRVAP